MVEIIPSILSADFARLAEDIARVESAGIRMLHLDIMDGHFVPNITIGPPVVRCIRRVTQLTLDVHLMVEEPEKFLDDFVQAGADQISVHQEACTHLDRTLRKVRASGVKVGVVLNPATPLTTLDYVLDLVDYVLLMTVNPGFGGQEFIPSMFGKIQQLNEMRKSRKLDFRIQVDGGVTLDNLPELVRCGVDWVVTGSKVFLSPDPAATVAEMKRVAAQAAALRV